MQLRLLVVLAAAGCTFPTVSASPPMNEPDRGQYAVVHDALQPSCGTLDCHGQVGRNLRLYGGQGLRLAPSANPSVDPTTEAEYQASFDSVVALEPDALNHVIAEGGADPERLSLVRKARGTERHAGGIQMQVDDPLDRCITSWLASATDSASCKKVSSAMRPGAGP